MKYQQKTFTLPAAPTRISQRDWDRATLAPDEFNAKYEFVADNTAVSDDKN